MNSGGQSTNQVLSVPMVMAKLLYAVSENCHAVAGIGSPGPVLPPKNCVRRPVPSGRMQRPFPGDVQSARYKENGIIGMKNGKGRPRRGSILITGCSSGIGYDAAIQLGARGWRVFATCRKDADCERMRQSGLESMRPRLRRRKQHRRCA